MTYINYIKQEALSEIIKIDFLDDGHPIIYIKTDSLEGIIIEDNKTLRNARQRRSKLVKVIRYHLFELIKITEEKRMNILFIF